MVRHPPILLARASLRHAALLALAACAGGAHAQAQRAEPATAQAVGSIQLVSTTTAGGAATVSSTTCSVSADGNLVLFASEASNLVAGDSNRVSDLFLRNLATGATTRVTTQSNGAQIAAGGNCLGTTMTPDGRVVAFNSGTAVFAKNTQTGVLIQASPPAGTVPQVTGFFGGVLSDDGSKLVFLTLPETTYAGAYLWLNVVPARLMLRDLGSGSLVTLATDNGIVGQGEVVSNRFAISPDGTKVAFVSSSASLVPGDTNGRADVFVRDLASGGTVVASSNSGGVPAVPVVSGSAFYWDPTFVSDTQLAFGTGQPSSLGEPGLYLKDLDTGGLTLVLDNVNGGSSARLSGQGRQVVFQRSYSGGSRVFVRDRATGVETLASASASGAASNGSSGSALISRDGTQVSQ
jgi:Tol biopolymer transport system component